MKSKDIILNIFKKAFFRNVFFVTAILLVIVPQVFFEKISSGFNNEILLNIKDDAKRVANHIYTRHFDIYSMISLNDNMNKIVEDFSVYKIKFFDKDGIVISSTDTAEIGSKNKHEYFYNKVVKGEIFYQLVKKGFKNLENKILEKDVVEIYIPFVEDGKFLGSFELYYDVTDKIKNIDILKNEIKLIQISIIIMIFILMIAITYYASKNDLKRNMVEKELVEEKIKALNASKSKSEFLANISHELRTPLNSIIGFNEILLTQEKEEEKLKKLKIVNSSSKTLLQLINDILDFSKIESGKIEIENIEFNIKKEIKEIVDVFAFQIQDKNIDFNVNIDEKMPAIIISDQLRIKQIILNLLSNAIKFTPKGNKITLNISTLEEDKKFKIDVIDTGIGIAEDKLGIIFDKFSQADNSTTRKFGGTGLGLAISKKLANLMGGDILLESKINEGSTFSLILPLIATPSNISLQSKSNGLKDFNISDSKILLVEDNEINQILFIELLKEYKLSCDIANDGLEALELYKSGKYDLIFMDDKMPNMDGITTINELKKIDKNHPPIVAFTANAMKEDKERFTQAGALNFLSKPIETEKLKDILYSYLN